MTWEKKYDAFKAASAKIDEMRPTEHEMWFLIGCLEVDAPGSVLAALEALDKKRRTEKS